MNCPETQRLIHGYVDGELDLVQNLAIEEHLQQCAACAQRLTELQGVRSAIKDGAIYFKPPPDLLARVQSSVRRASKAGPSHRPLPRRLLAIAASLVFVTITAWALLHLLPFGSADASLTQELLASHVRSQMLPNHRVDVESSDQHTIKPWFEGKLDFSPAVHDLADHGFLLVGGRLDYLDNRPVAAVVYQRRKHLINLFIWRSRQGQETALTTLTRQGFHLFHWAQSGMTYWAVSDLNASELQEFVHLIQEKAK